MVKLYAGLLTILLLAGCTGSDVELPNTYSNEGVALMGYDVVSYHTQNKAQPGDPKHSLQHDGLTYHFASNENKVLFAANPGKFKPAYGGWCAYAVADSSTKMAPDPEKFIIQDGRLLMFFDGFINVFIGSLTDKWQEAPDTSLSTADKNWGVMTAN